MRDRFTVGQISMMLGLSPRQIRTFVSLDILDPAIGPRGRFEFSFQDLVVLRTAKSLLDDDIPAVRVHRLLRELAENLDAEESVTNFSVRTDGTTIVVVREGESWEPFSGQEVLDFDTAELDSAVGGMTAATHPARESAADAEAWFVYGDEVEGSDVGEAVRAYARAIELDPEHADALINLGRLKHRGGHLDAARRMYLAAIDIEPTNALAWFNLGVVCEDRGDDTAAAEAYESSLRAGWEIPDAHRNLAEICERRGEHDRALAHLKDYKRLTSR